MVEKMASCVVCGRKATDIVYDKKKKVWVFNCPEHIVPQSDLVVPRHMIEQLK
jgi:hypothetical protein